MRFKKFIFLSIAIFTTMTLCSCYKSVNNFMTNLESTTSKEPNTLNQYSLTTEQKQLAKAKDGRTYLIAKYPIININGAINKDVSDTIYNYNNQAYESAKEYIEEQNEYALEMLFNNEMYKDNPDAYFKQDVEAFIERADEKLIVIGDKLLFDTGGAHPTSTYTYTNINVSDGRVLTIDDVIIDKDKFYDILKTELKNQNPEFEFNEDWEETINNYKKGYISFDDANPNSKIELNLDFGLLKGELLVHFNAYDLGSYAAGPISASFKYSNEEFNNLVKNEYK